jgi:hypothetical protein
MSITKSSIYPTFNNNNNYNNNNDNNVQGIYQDEGVPLELDQE